MDAVERVNALVERVEAGDYDSASAGIHRLARGLGLWARKFPHGRYAKSPWFIATRTNLLLSHREGLDDAQALEFLLDQEARSWPRELEAR
jgi:hypothetical protein